MIKVAVPIACTLPPASFRRRADFLRALGARSLLAYQEDRRSLRLTYRSEVKREIEEVVDEERRCCGFLAFDLLYTANTVELTITAPEELHYGAREVFACFLPEH